MIPAIIKTALHIECMGRFCVVGFVGLCVAERCLLRWEPAARPLNESCYPLYWAV